MKKIIKWVRNNLLGFIICAVMFSAIGVVAATLISSSEVSYNNANSGSSATTVKGALDELYNMAQNCASGGATGLSTAYYVYGSPYSSLTTTDYNNVKDGDGNKRNVFLRYQNNKIAVCIILNNKLECFEEGNHDYERFHMMQAFNGSCNFNSGQSGTSLYSTITCKTGSRAGDLITLIELRGGRLEVNEILSTESLSAGTRAYVKSCVIGPNDYGNFFKCYDTNIILKDVYN